MFHFSWFDCFKILKFSNSDWFEIEKEKLIKYRKTVFFFFSLLSLSLSLFLSFSLSISHTTIKFNKTDLNMFIWCSKILVWEKAQISRTF